MKKYILFFTIILFIVSCSNDNDLNDQYSLVGEVDPKSEVVLQERDPNLPKIWSKKSAKAQRIESRVAFTDATDFLGNSYAVENGSSIVGDFANAKFPIVNIAKLLEKYPSYIVAKELRTTSTDAFSYADFDRLEVNSSFSQKVKKGFSLNVGIFKFGRKKTITETFVHNTLNENRVAHGELSIEVVNGMLSLQTVASARRRIAADYLDEVFVDALYNSSMKELIESYGEFVLTGYYTGGRASALYYGVDKTNTTYDKKESSMEKEVNASFTWKKGTPIGNDSINSASGELSIGRNKGNSSSVTNTFSELKYSVKTLGGAYGYTVATPSRDVSNFQLDLTNWLNSLNDPKTHTMIDLQDNGLSPISDFILEENFQERYNDTHMEFQTIDYLDEPYIEIQKVYVRKSSSGEKLYDIVPVLSTRQGDKLIFSNSNASSLSDSELRANSNAATFTAKSTAIKNEKSKYYKLAIKANANKIINPIIRNPLSFEINNVKESGMYKFLNSNTNIWYVYNPSSLYAFAYYNDDYIPDAYGISDWLENVPVKSVSMTTLYQRYRIFGL